MNKIVSFVNWCESENLELPVPSELAKLDERSGSKESLYPPAYYGGQYCDLWKIPHSADAAYYGSVKKDKKDTKKKN